MLKKTCKKCGSFKIKKDGNMRGKQRYKCTSCWYVFQNSGRIKIDKQILREEYTRGKQTYKQLSNKYGVSVYTIRNLLDSVDITPEIPITTDRDVVITIDTTYFWRVFGVMVFRCEKLKKNLLWKIVKHETKELYHQGIVELEGQWWIIKAIVCDGRRGIIGSFGDVPIQMCVFHQMKIMRRYLTRFPRTEAGKELKDISSMLGKIRKRTMVMWLDDRYRKYKSFIYERNDNGDFMHPRVLKAYRSLQRNFKYLFTYQDHAWKIDIPTTTNSLDWTFSHLKQKLGLHRWLDQWRKEKFIHDYLSK